MTSRALAVAGVAVVTFGSLAVPVATQRPAAPPLVITAYNNGAPIPYTTPRTPWGDPDLQGVWSSDDTAGIPRERPANLGNRLYQTDEEWAARQKQVSDGVSRGENAVGSFRNDYATRAFRQTSLIVDPPDGRQPAVTPEAEKRRAPRDRGTFGNGPFNYFEDFTLYDRCITRGIVGSVLRVVYGNGNRIVQAPGMVAFGYEMIHDTRIIYTDGRPHIGQGIRQYLGDPRGRWEGDTLVVEVTNFSNKTDFRGSRETLRLVERFTRVNADTISYTVTIDDPATFTKPWTIGVPLKDDRDQREIFEYACHEGNYAMRNILSGARADEEAAAR
jgi:hypothetical protein